MPQETCTIHTAENVVKVCKDCPILDAEGLETGMYHIAGEFCPEESVVEMCLPNYEREPIGTAVAQDDMYRKSEVELLGPCTVHTEPIAPPVEDPLFPWFPWFPENPDEQDPGTEPWEPNGPSQDIGGGTTDEIVPDGQIEGETESDNGGMNFWSLFEN